MGAVDRTAIHQTCPLLGRFLVTRQDADIGAFQTPGLRNLLMTAPYFHDGSRPTLWDVLDHYKRVATARPFLDAEMRPLAAQGDGNR